MLQKIIGKKNSIQRGLIYAVIVIILFAEIISLIEIGIFFNNKEILVSLTSRDLANEISSEYLNKVVKTAALIGIFNVVLVVCILVGIFSRKMLIPIQKLSEATKKVASGDFNIKLETKREDEIGELTNNFNKMVEDLKSIENLQKEFIDNVSHEIKTPITSIQGFAELLEDDNITKEERIEYAKIIREESQRISKLSTNMLKLSKLQNQNRITNKEQVDLAEQIRKAISLLEPKWKEKNITFNISMEEKYFYGDEDLIFQVFVNLIDNAIKFSNQDGSIDISLVEKENWINIKIKDNGIGIEKEQLEKIFTRFYQIDKSHSEEGSGLGLAIVKRIIELCKGEIKIESKKDVGTIINIKLPIEKETNEVLIE